MLSPIKRQRAALLAKNSPSQGATTSGDEPKSLHLLLPELDSDKKVLKGFQRIEDKVAHKREVLIPKYKAAVKEYLESQSRFDNPLFSQMIIWLFDVDDLEIAIEMCDVAIERGLDTPADFKRDFATFCADEVLTWCERMSAQGHSIEPYFSQIFTKVREEWRINEKLTAKWFKFAGLYLLRDEDGKPRASAVGNVETLEAAKALLIEADKQSSAAQVKTHIDKIDQRLRAIKDGTNL